MKDSQQQEIIERLKSLGVSVEVAPDSKYVYIIEVAIKDSSLPELLKFTEKDDE